MSDINLISLSGGKDSTATLLLALERNTPNLRAVFADTGHEHELTYKYVNYLERMTGVAVQRVKADFAHRIANKREVVQTKWVRDGVPQENIDAALEILHPTGNPFLDLCIWKGRFPSTKVRFCTEELKVLPIQEQVYWPILRETDNNIISWQGIRWDESRARASAVEREGIEPDAARVFAYRPILAWKADDVFAMHAKHGIDPNPLYKQGMGRVGCMPCINCAKGELAQIAMRFPEVIEKLKAWEEIVSKAAKWQSGTFFPTLFDPTSGDDVDYKTHGIERMVEWSLTERGGRQMSLIPIATNYTQCRSIYGLCE